MSWENLSLREKAAYIRTGVKNGIKDINGIKGAYNKFAEGGHIYDGETEPTQQMDIPYSSQAVLNAALANPNGGIFIGDKSIPHEDREYNVTLPEVTVKGKDYNKPYESAYNDDLKTLILQGIPEAGSWLMGNTVGKVVNAVPGASEGLSLVTPSRWAGTVGGALNGEFIAPWSENNQGWSSLVGNEYGEAADFYGDLFLGSKLMKGMKKGAKGVADSPKTAGYTFLDFNNLNKLYEKIPQKYRHTYDIGTDVINPTNWGSIVKARINGEYPITKKEVYNYYRRAIKEAEEGVLWNKDLLEESPVFSELRKNYPDYMEMLPNLIFNPKVMRGSRYSIKYGTTSFGKAMTPDFLTKNKITEALKLTGARSNIPVLSLKRKGQSSLFGTAAHEGNHGVQKVGDVYNQYSETSPYIETVWNPEVSSYYSLNPDFNNTKLKAISKSRPWRDSWVKSPNEVWSEFANYRATNGIKYNPNGYSKSVIDDFVDKYHNRFTLGKKDFRDVVNWGVENHRAYGGNLITNNHGN